MAAYRLGAAFRRGVASANRFDSISRRTASAALQAAQKNPNSLWPDADRNDAGWYVGANYLRMYAGDFDGATSTKTGYSVRIGAAEALFEHDKNDLVVSTDSATMGKQYRILSDTTHFDYFKDGTVQYDLRSF